MAEMSSLERCMTVLQGGIPDRVPVCLENFMHAAAVAGYTVREYFQDGEKIAAAHITAWEKFRHDLIDMENGTSTLAQAVGCQIGFSDENSSPWVARPILESLEQVEDLKPIDPYQDGTLPEMIKATRLIAKELGQHVCILAEGDQGPFDLASQLIKLEDFLFALVDPEQEALVHRLLEYTCEQHLRYTRALIDAGAHLTMMGESVASPDVCSPSTYRQFAYPYEKRLVETMRAEGKRIGIHICGNATRIIEPMVDTGSAFLQVDYKIDREVCKRATQGKTTLIGTIDPSGVMALGTVEDVIQAARQDIDQLAPGGGFILSPGCTLPYTTPSENVAALVETAKTYGRYDRG